MNLNFDPVRHEYFLDKERIPGLTTVLSDMGCSDARWAKEEHRDRGSAVHQLCAEIAMLERPDSDFDWDGTCDKEIAIPYGISFQKFLKKSGFVVEPGMVELAVYSSIFQAAGTFDMWGWSGMRRVLIDIKSGKPQPSVNIQLAGYRFMLRESRGVETDVSYALWLDKDGGMPKVVQPERPAEDERIFKSLMEVWHWRKAHGMLPWKGNGNGSSSNGTA